MFRKIFVASLFSCTLVLVQGSLLALPVSGLSNGSGTVQVSGGYVDFYGINGTLNACSVGPGLGTPG